MKELLFILSLLSFSVYGQDNFFISENIADCSGAAEILNPGSYSIQFTGGSGAMKDLNAYPGMKDIKEKNSLFFKFTAPYDGRLTLDATISEGLVQLFIFQGTSENLADDILQGTAMLKREIRNPATPTVGLSLVIDENKLYPLEMKRGDKIMIMFNTAKKGTSLLDFVLKFEYKKDENDNVESYKKIVDQRSSESASTFHLGIRDAETQNPVIADVNIKDKKTSSLYSGSDFYFDADIAVKLSIKCDAAGYFFLDKEINIAANPSKEEIIYMKPLSQGKILKIDKIEFVMGTSNLIPGTESILNRVKDFLVLNAGIRIEIQGHVNNEGSDNLTSTRLSKKRAKKVMKFLIDSGINKKRLSAKGFGNKQPLFDIPKSAREQQANRRVEIKIL